MKNEQPLDGNRQPIIRRVSQASLIGIGGFLILVGSVIGARQYRKITPPSSQPLQYELANSAARQEGTSDGKVRISVEDPRPVAKAITMLEARFGWAISYEDPRYINTSDISDVTETVRRDLDKFKPGKAPKVLVPRGGPFVFEYDYSRDSKRPDPDLILAALLAAHTGSGNAGRFRLVSSGRMFHVVPTAIKDISGKVVPQESVLDVTISLPAKERTGWQLIEALCAEVSRSVQLRVVVGSAPYGLLSQHEDREGIESMKARDLLARLLENAGKGRLLSWQLFYDPGMRMYVLNIHPV